MNPTLKFMIIGSLALGLGIAGCSRGESPDQTRSDVRKAQAEGQKDVAEERRDAAADSAAASHRVALAKAEADHDVAIERCEAMTGDARSSCKEDAGKALEVAQARADENKADADPKR